MYIIIIWQKYVKNDCLVEVSHKLGIREVDNDEREKLCWGLTMIKGNLIVTGQKNLTKI